MSQNLDDIPPQSTDTLTRKQLEIFKNEIVPEIRQIVKETTEQEAKEADNAINVNKNPSVDEINTLQRQGENFNIVRESEPKTDYNAKLDLAPNVRDLSKLTTDEITADLEYLANKHPEIFNKPSEVFKLIREIKDNPTHYFNNYRLDASLIVKRLSDNKIGKMAIKKDNGEVIHATKVRERDLGRMDRVSRQTAGTSTLPAPLKTAEKMPLKQDANSVGETYLSATDEIIPQTATKELSDDENLKEQLLFSIKNDYDLERFLSDREGILAKDARYGRSRISDAQIRSFNNGDGWEREFIPAGYEKNYKADF